MDQLTQIGLSIRLWLASIHPVAPWVALAAAFWLVDAAADRFGLTAALERKLPFGKLLARTIDTLPVVVLGAAWANIASGDAALDSAVLGAVAAALRPVCLAAKEWILGTEKTLPADGGPSAGPMLALLLVGLPSAPILSGCTESRAPGRDACYLQADADAMRRYVAECDGYDSTSECPAAQAIEEAHQVAQESCP